MDRAFRQKIVEIVGSKLTEKDIEELVTFFKYAFKDNIDQDVTDEHFYRDLAFELSASAKELALLIIEYRKELKKKIHPGITDLTKVYIPQAADQLEGIIETTETVANRIMDNLETMQERTEKMAAIMAYLKEGRIIVPGEEDGVSETEIDDNTRQKIEPLIEFMGKKVKNDMAIISDIFVQMSFQDLTGQRIRRIMSLVQQMEGRLRKMVVSFGIKIAEKEKNPNITDKELAHAVAKKESELAGPQKVGQGLDQAGIDEILANI